MSASDLGAPFLVAIWKPWRAACRHSPRRWCRQKQSHLAVKRQVLMRLHIVQVHFMDSLKFFLSLYGHKLPVLSMDISTDSSLLISGSADKNIKIWGLDFGDCHRSLFAHADSIMQASDPVLVVPSKALISYMPCIYTEHCPSFAAKSIQSRQSLT